MNRALKGKKAGLSLSEINSLPSYNFPHCQKSFHDLKPIKPALNRGNQE